MSFTLWHRGSWVHVLNTNWLCNQRTDEKKSHFPSQRHTPATVYINRSHDCRTVGFYEAIFLFNNTTHTALSKSQCADQSLTLAGPWERQHHALEIKTKSTISVLISCHLCTLGIHREIWPVQFPCTLKEKCHTTARMSIPLTCVLYIKALKQKPAEMALDGS